MKIAKYQTSKSVTLISLVSMKKLKNFLTGRWTNIFSCDIVIAINAMTGKK